MTPLEREKMLADPTNPPGTIRKIGPSLRRLSEKTNQTWVRRWLAAPRSFRPDTKMPHFYGLSNNQPEILPEDQKEFPDAEIHSIAYYLLHESQAYLAGKDTYLVAIKDRQAELDEKKKNNLLSEQELKELEEIKRRLEIAGKPIPIRERLFDSEGAVVQLPGPPSDEAGRKEQIHRGRQWFSERGCLACHTHHATTQKDGDLPAIDSQADFGPNLSELAAKIAPEGGDEDSRRRWLVQWIMNPNIHWSRTRMPITHLLPAEAADVAAWLLSRPTDEWKTPDPPSPKADTLERMARLYLEKSYTRQEASEILAAKGLSAAQEDALKTSRRDADELHLAASRKDQSWDQKLQWYIG